MSALPIDFLADISAGSGKKAARTGNFAIKAIGALAAALAAGAIAITVTRQDAALEALRQETAQARANADAVLSRMAASDGVQKESEAVRKLKADRSPSVHIIDELTRLLPDSAWINDLKIEGDTVDISGFAKPAAALVPVLERSKLFSSAALSAPVVLDSGEDKERFSFRLRLRQAASASAPEPKGPAA